MALDDDKTFYTETMARLLTQQGRYQRAAEVYRYLLEQTPHRADLEKALATVLSLTPKGAENWGAVSGLVESWVTLMLKYKTLLRLQRLSIPHPAGQRSDE